ncbi:MAG: hypothetical protein JJT78_10635 [Leptospira sp.]|nr:hypothetical protein [Leptospira sp.]
MIDFQECKDFFHRKSIFPPKLGEYEGMSAKDLLELCKEHRDVALEYSKRNLTDSLMADRIYEKQKF